MKKSNRNYIKELEPKQSSIITFEMEENADEIFLDFLNSQPIPAKEKSYDLTPPKTKTAPNRSQCNWTIDLHGLCLDDAIYSVDTKIKEIIASKANLKTLKVITGKGRHSGENGGVLAREIHKHIQSSYRKKIFKISESPANIQLNGLPIRGHFSVQFK